MNLFEQIKIKASHNLLEADKPEYITDSKGTVHPVTGEPMPEEVKDKLDTGKQVAKLAAYGLITGLAAKHMLKRGGGLSKLIKHEKYTNKKFADFLTKRSGTINKVRKGARKVFGTPAERILKNDAKRQSVLHMPMKDLLSKKGKEAFKNRNITKAGTLRNIKSGKTPLSSEALKKRQELIRKLNPNLPVAKKV